MAGFIFALVSIALGLIVAAMGQALLALREIAMNTRPQTADSQHKSKYEGLVATGRVLGAVGAFIAIVGAFVGVGSALLGQPLL